MLSTRKPLFWVLFSTASFACILFAFKFFSSAFPIVNLNISADKNSVMRLAEKMADAHHWGPAGYHQAASFETDTTVKTYVELEAGGKKAFANMLTEHFYMPYTWHVRHFKEHNVNETTICFKPDGTPYGFVETVAEETAGVSLNSQQAQEIAEATAKKQWHIDFTPYTLIEPSKKTHPNGRTDHTFVYERTDAYIGKGFYRLKLVVSGDQLTELTHFVHVPENFTLRYKEMRSSNDSIAQAASIIFLLFYVLGGCIIGLVFLLKRRWVVWQPALRWAIFISALGLCTMINQLPLLWMQYDTSLSIATFLSITSLKFFFGTVAQLSLLTIAFSAAESLSRKAFGHHPQLWHAWSIDAASSTQIWGRTIGGFLLVGIYLAFAITLYFITTTYFGWWTPSEELFNPNILATYLPWLTPLSMSLAAGFMEECLFRAVPLACAMLMGKKYGRPLVWISIAMIVQAVVFGAAHANYPAFPAYARIIELIIPSLMFGIVYLVFGLLPTIITHFVYDVVWFSLPIFISTAPYAWLNKLLIVLGTFIPLCVIVYARFKKGRWHSLPAKLYNASWSPAVEKEIQKTEERPQTVHTLPAVHTRAVFLAGIVAFVVWLMFVPKKDDAQPLALSRTQAVAQAQEYLTQNNINLDQSWFPLSGVASTKNSQERSLEHRFVWQNNQEAYRLLLQNAFLQAPYWSVRFIKTTGSVDDRAEEFYVQLNDTGVLRFIHFVPQSMTGNTLSQEQARTIAYDTIKKNYQLTHKDVQEISAESIKMPARQDWLFVFKNTQLTVPAQGQARIGVYIAGDLVTDSARTIFVPEQWSRNEQNNLSRLQTILTLGLFFLFVLMALGMRSMHRHMHISRFFFLKTFVCFFVLTLTTYVNTWPAVVSNFSPILPWFHQVLTQVGILGVTLLVMSAALTYLFLMITSYKHHTLLKKTWRYTCVAVSAGIIAATILLFIKKIIPSTEPFWADYETLNTFVPTLAIITTALYHYFVNSMCMYIILVGIDYYAQKNRWYNLLFFVAGFAITVKFALGSLLAWFVGGLTLGLILWVLYLFMLRYDLSLIFVVVATLTILQAMQSVFFNPFSGAQAAWLVSAVLIFIVGRWFFMKL